MFREDLIVELVEGKHVLDCGGVDHSFVEEKQASGEWLHATIAHHAQHCVGVDILAHRVEQINRTGKYKFLVANVEELDFEREFDISKSFAKLSNTYHNAVHVSSMAFGRPLKGMACLFLQPPIVTRSR